MLGYTPLGVGLETPKCGPGDPQVWAWRPPSVGLETPPGVGLETPPWPDPSTSPGCGPGDTHPWRPARHAGILPHQWTEWQTGAKILPCPKLHLRVVNIWKPYQEVNSAIHKAAGWPAAVQNGVWRSFCTAVPHWHFSVLQGTAGN